DSFSIDYDVESYRDLAAKARESGKLNDHIAAAQIYTGHFLVGIESDWVDNIRQNLQSEHLSLLQNAAELAMAAADLTRATSIYQKMTEHEPFSEVAWEGLAEVWDKRGERAKADNA